MWEIDMASIVEQPSSAYPCRCRAYGYKILNRSRPRACGLHCPMSIMKHRRETRDKGLRRVWGRRMPPAGIRMIVAVNQADTDRSTIIIARGEESMLVPCNDSNL